MRKDKKNLYITIPPYKKYIEDIDFLAKNTKSYLNIYVVCVNYWDNKIFSQENYSFYIYNAENVLELKNIQKNKNNIIMRYWRWYFDYITYFLDKDNLLLHPDWMWYKIWTNNFSIPIIEKRKDSLYSILFLYFRFYWFLNTFKMLFQNRVLNDKTDLYWEIKNYWLLELTKIYNDNLINMDNNTKEKNQILILEQPFIKNLEKVRLDIFFNFIDELIEKNPNYKVVFKIHPRSDEKFYKENIKSKNIYFEKWDIIEFIKESKYILWLFSTALFSALLFNKKVIAIDPINLFKDIKKFELLKYKNTNYMLKAQDLDSIIFDNSWKEKKVEELLFDFEKFKNDIENTNINK